MRKQSKGITLVALVITIIILLILAGISISALTNQGLFGKTFSAKKEEKSAKVVEWLNLKLMEEQMCNPGGTAEAIIPETQKNVNANINELKKIGKEIIVEETRTEEDGENVHIFFYVHVDEDTYKVEMSGTTVVTIQQLITEIKLNKTETNLEVGASETLTATIIPSNVSNKKIIWSSSNTDVATVTEGTIIAVAEGTTIITATAQDGSNVQGSCELKVEKGKVYLYNCGDKCESVTGGYVIDRNTYATSGGMVTWNATNVYLKGAITGNMGEYGIRTVNRIDYSKYSKIYINVIGVTISSYYKVGRNSL